MKISLVTESFYPAVDAATTTVKAVADRLLSSGHEVQVIAPGPGLASYRSAPVARIRPLDHPGGEVRAALEAFRPDLVHVTSPGRLGRKALKYAGRLGLPTLTLQQSAVDDLTSDYWLRKVADRSDHLVVTCGWMQERISSYGLEVPDLWVPGVDTDGFGPQLRDDQLHGKWSRRRSAGGPRTVVGYVGSLHKRNGVRQLVEAASAPSTRLVVIGEGPQDAWLRDHLPGAKVLGRLSPGELATAIASLDLLVHPGLRETDCHALREAMASGVPVVAPAAGGPVDLVEDGVTGLLYDPAEALGLRLAVTRLARSTERQVAMGEAARRAVASRPWSTAVDELVDLHYATALRGTPWRAAG